MTEQTAFPVKETGTELGSMAGAVVLCLGAHGIGVPGPYRWFRALGSLPQSYSCLEKGPHDDISPLCCKE